MALDTLGPDACCLGITITHLAYSSTFGISFEYPRGNSSKMFEQFFMPPLNQGSVPSHNGFSPALIRVATRVFSQTLRATKPFCKSHSRQIPKRNSIRAWHGSLDTTRSTLGGYVVGMPRGIKLITVLGSKKTIKAETFPSSMVALNPALSLFRG